MRSSSRRARGLTSRHSSKSVTRSRAVVDGASELTIWGDVIKVAAQVHTIGGLSAHADQKELVGWLGHLRDRPPVALVHGENGALAGLARALAAEGWNQVDIPALGTAIDLAALPNLIREQ